MIIIGYPGIGKSTLVRENQDMRIIDLESSNFKNSDLRPGAIAEIYCKVAVDLSRQGYTVFVSSHIGVQRTLLEYIDFNDHVFVCYPALSLKSDWIRRLRERYQYSYAGTDEREKNLRALEHVLGNYDEDINTLHNSGYAEIVIEDLNYSLKELIFGNDHTKS